jgi:predicted TIM-barrel fold metal-dependent hydrolase
MLIVDAQIHLWSQNLPTNPAHRQVPSYSAEECLMEMDQGGVGAALIHPPGWDPNSLVVAESACVRYPERFAILGNFPPEKPESRELIAGWMSRPGMLGLRWAFTQPHQQTWMTDGTMDWVWPACEQAGIPVALMASNYLPLVAQIAERHPSLKLIIDHLGRARGGQDDAAFTYIAQVCGLA